MQLSPSDRPGLIATIVAGALSLGAVLLFAVYLAARAARPGPAGTRALMGDAHMTAYFFSMLLANVFKAGSVVMSAAYLRDGLQVRAGAFCSTQAALKLLGNVGSAVWSLVIAAHVFNLLFRRLAPRRWGLPAVLAGVWALLGAGVLLGPAALSASSPFFGPDADLADGSPCWITAAHTTARFLLEYLPTGVCITGSALLLGATLAALRGNVYFTGGRTKVRRLAPDDAWHDARLRDGVDTHVLMTVKRMACFPLAYLVLWAPVAVARLIDAAGHTPAFGFVAFALTTFALTGFADVALYVVTRRVILPAGVVTPAYADVAAEWADDDKPPPPPPPPARPRALFLHPHPPRVETPDVFHSDASAPVYVLPVPPARTASAHGGAGRSRAGSVSSSSAQHARAASADALPSRWSASTPGTWASTPAALASKWSASTPGGALASKWSATTAEPSRWSASTPGGALASEWSASTAEASRWSASAPGTALTATPSHGSATSASGPPTSFGATARSGGSAATTGTATEVGGRWAGAATFLARARAGAPVEPLQPHETFKARLYGARFSLVAGPAPAYDYDRAHA